MKEIIEGWKNVIIKDEDIELVALERMEICIKCPFIKNDLITRCDKCGCPLQAKTRSPKSKCPENKW